jgi:hypothetical protein
LPDTKKTWDQGSNYCGGPPVVGDSFLRIDLSPKKRTLDHAAMANFCS